MALFLHFNMALYNMIIQNGLKKVNYVQEILSFTQRPIMQEGQ
ncbi:hypothetical protein LM7456_110010 [Listeria monocytogenes]|nr:hypothetical protein LM7456_110010 [Listeria monocytogenes]